MTSVYSRDNLPASILSKPAHILEEGILAATTAISKGLSQDEATFACLQRIKSLEGRLKPAVVPSRKVPEHVMAVLKAKVQEPEVQQSIQRSIQREFLGKNALPVNQQRTLVSADFNQKNQLVLTFDTGEQIITKAVDTDGDISQQVTVAVNPVFDYVRFNTDLNADIPHEEGLLFYDKVDHCLAYYNEHSNVKVSLSREQMVRVYNNNPFIILDGKAVHINGAFQGWPTIDFTIASSKADTESTIGICTGTIDAYDYGYVCISGNVNGLNTSMYPPGTVLYISESTAGDLTSTPIMQPNYNVEVATVLNQDAINGAILVRVDKKPWYPSLELVHPATLALPTVPTIFKPSTTLYNDGFTYSSTTGEIEFLVSSSYGISMQFNALPSASNKYINFYFEMNTGTGWTPMLYSGRRHELINNYSAQILFSDNEYFRIGTKLRIQLWADATVNLITSDLVGTAPGTVKLPAFRMNIA